MIQFDAFPKTIKIVEVGPRDGLQNITTSLSAHTRATLVNKLSEAGLKHIEAGSFVSPVKVPAMAETAEVFNLITRQPDTIYAALTPNLKGLEQAIESGVSEVAVFASASEGFSQHNINCSISESLKRFESVIEVAGRHSMRVRGYISCVLGCPYDGNVQPDQVAHLCQDMLQMGCYEVSLGDTIGIGTPLKAKELFNKVTAAVPVESIAVHFHNTYGQALANLYAVIEEGLCVIDSAVAGLGGCPYAPGASGNVATEDVLYMLQGMDIKTGIEMKGLLAAADYICQSLGILPQSNVTTAMMSSTEYKKGCRSH